MDSRANVSIAGRLGTQPQSAKAMVKAATDVLGGGKGKGDVNNEQDTNI